MAADILVFDPTAPYGRKEVQAHGGLGDLRGKVVGFIDNAKPNFNHLADDLAELLIGRYGMKRAVKCNKRSPGIPAPQDVMTRIVEECDVVITGSGD
jgi:hypothetical protein